MKTSGVDDLAVGTLICFTSATLSNLGLIIMKSVVMQTSTSTAAVAREPHSAPDRIEVILGAVSEDQEDGNGNVVISAEERRDAYRRDDRSSSLLEDFLITKDTSMRVLSRGRANIWWFNGLLLFVAGQILNLVSLSFLEQTVWAVLSLFSLVANAVSAHFILGEPFSFHDFLATGLIIFGSVLVVIANDTALVSDDVDWTIPKLMQHFRRPWFVIYCLFLTTLLLVSIIHGARSIGRGERVHALTWTIFSSTCGSVSVLLGKCVVEMLTTIAHSNGGFASPEAAEAFSSVSFYIIFGVFITAALGALISLNMALAVGEAMLVIPWLTVTNTLLAILGGIFYFEEFSSLKTMTRTLLFTSGVIIAIMGSVFLQQGRDREPVRRRASLLSAPDHLSLNEETYLINGSNGHHAQKYSS